MTTDKYEGYVIRCIDNDSYYWVTDETAEDWGLNTDLLSATVFETKEDAEKEFHWLKETTQVPEKLEILHMKFEFSWEIING